MATLRMHRLALRVRGWCTWDPTKDPTNSSYFFESDTIGSGTRGALRQPTRGLLFPRAWNAQRIGPYGCTPVQLTKTIAAITFAVPNAITFAVPSQRRIDVQAGGERR